MNENIEKTLEDLQNMADFKDFGKENTEMIAVPAIWFEGLLERASVINDCYQSYEYGINDHNDVIFRKTIALMGYAISTEVILKNNERLKSS